MNTERINLRASGRTRDEAMGRAYKQVEQYAPGVTWGEENVIATPTLVQADGSVTLWRVDVELERRFA